MKKPILAHFLIFALFITPVYIHAQEATDAHKDSLKTIIDQYYTLNLSVFQSGSTVEDIDAIFAMFTEDFTYVHPKYGGTYTRENLYNGYVNNQKNGGYNGKVVAFKRENMIIGLNAVVVEKRFMTKGENGPIAGKLEMTLFEIRKGQISRILEYW